MTKEVHNPVVNSNCQNFILSNSRGKQVHPIRPDKFTFLKSNLLIPNIVNRSVQIQKRNQTKQYLEQSDAYVNCVVQMHKLQQQTEIKRAKYQRVRNLAKCRSQITFEQLRNQQKSINQKIQNVYILRKEMGQKAAEIMGKKQDNSYLGRNMYKHKQNLLKELKETNPFQKNQKTQTIRLLMKQYAKKCNRKQFRQLLQDSCTNSSYSKQFSRSNISTSMQISLLDISNIKAVEQKIHNDEVLKKLIKSKSSQDFMQQQKRRAVWNGFSQHWKMGCEKHEQTAKELKRKRQKKPLKPKFQKSDHEILNYHDNYTKHLAMKKYENAFAQTSTSFQLKISKESPL